MTNLWSRILFVCGIGVIGISSPAYAIIDFSEVSKQVRGSIGVVETLFFDEQGHHNITYTGTGFIISRNGYVLTNHHVISSQGGQLSKIIRITFWKDGTGNMPDTYSARLLGVDKVLDIALLKIDSNSIFEPLTLGDSSALTLGEIVGVYGYGKEGGVVRKGLSFTEGYLHSRRIALLAMPFVQHLSFHSLIYSGASGGPVINTRGEVVAVVAQTKQAVDNGASLGVIAAIPINDVQVEVLKHGSLNTGMLDISWVVVQSAEIRYWRERFRIEYPFAARVLDPRNTKFKMNDLIIAFGGIKVTSAQELEHLVRTHQDQTVIFNVIRGEEVLNLSIFINHSDEVAHRSP